MIKLKIKLKGEQIEKTFDLENYIICNDNVIQKSIEDYSIDSWHINFGTYLYL